MAHQGGKIRNPPEKDKFFQWLDKLEHGIFAVPRSNLNILLYVPAEIAYQLIEKKELRAYLAGEKKDIHEEDINHLRYAQQTFLEIAKGKRDWITIDCTENGKMLSEQAIADKVWCTVKSIL
jgi:dTMP kinase